MANVDRLLVLGWAQLCLVHNAEPATQTRALERLRSVCTEIGDARETR